jgi:hypothetical protein
MGSSTLVEAELIKCLEKTDLIFHLRIRELWHGWWERIVERLLRWFCDGSLLRLLPLE